EPEAERADDEAAHEQRATVDAVKIDRRQIREDKARFAADFRLRVLDRRRRGTARRKERREHARQQDGAAPPHKLLDRDHQTSRVTRRGPPERGHYDRHKSPNYMRTLGGSAMPPVRKILMPSSTEMSGNTARLRSQMTMSPR